MGCFDVASNHLERNKKCPTAIAVIPGPKHLTTEQVASGFCSSGIEASNQIKHYGTRAAVETTRGTRKTATYVKYRYVPHKAVAEVSKIGNL